MNDNKIVHFTHHDLDALGCTLHLNFATKNFQKESFHTNYRDLEQKVSEVYDYCFNNNPQVLIITDISFSGTPQLLHKLEDILEICPVILFDHHEYPEGFFDDFKIIHKIDITKSATKITQEYFKTKGKNKNLDVLSDFINTFDIWLSKEKGFKIALAMNNYFWTVNEKISIEEFADKIKDNDYKLPNFKAFYELNTKKFKKYIKKYREKKLVTSDGFFCVAFVDEFFNEILHEEFSKGTEFVFIANSYGITRFRFNAYGNLTRKEKEKIKIKLIGTLDIGHLNAFSSKIENSNFDKIMSRVEEVYKILKKYKKDKKWKKIEK